ncbi:MAG TPA: hypothetical protein EYP04_01830 [Anaerolineae bacterium]|nr:hypothetical protein [Anaerolineae bacterium]
MGLGAGLVGATVAVAEGVPVGVKLGVAVAVLVADGVTVGDAVPVAVGVGVGVDVNTSRGLAVGGNVAVSVGSPVEVDKGVGDAVGVDDGTAAGMASGFSSDGSRLRSFSTRLPSPGASTITFTFAPLGMLMSRLCGTTTSKSPMRQTPSCIFFATPLNVRLLTDSLLSATARASLRRSCSCRSSSRARVSGSRVRINWTCSVHSFTPYSG